MRNEKERETRNPRIRKEMKNSEVLLVCKSTLGFLAVDKNKLYYCYYKEDCKKRIGMMKGK